MKLTYEKLPKFLYVDGRRWSVVVDPNLARRTPELSGECRYARREIAVAPKLSAYALFGVMLHEILHASLPKLNEWAVQEAEYNIAIFLARICGDKKLSQALRRGRKRQLKQRRCRRKQHG